MSTQPRLVEVRQNVLKQNDVLARSLRKEFDDAGVLVVSLVSTPGAGKTALLEHTLTRMREDGCRVAALVGDLKHVVFLGLGFETTAPSTAMTVLQAAKEDVKNFSVFCNHITIIPALKAMLDSPDLQLSGFLGPGHVSTVIGTRCYEFVPRDYAKPLVVTGFEPLDVLQSAYMIVKQIVEGRAEIENQYARVVSREGNRKALEVLFEVFEPRDYFEWRGLWVFSPNRLRCQKQYESYDARLGVE